MKVLAEGMIVECITIPQNKYDELVAVRDRYKAALETLMVRSCCKPCDACFKTLTEALTPHKGESI